MEHPVSFLYHPVNKLLMALFGSSSARYQELMGLHESGYWLPDHVVMAILAVVVINFVSWVLFTSLLYWILRSGMGAAG